MGDTRLKFSIIIPVYNVEEYINECVDSVIRQSFRNYEIILVDDGSTDNSGKICDEYERKHDLIKVIHKENGGLSSARNIGIQNAKGDYLLFIDSDDYIAKGSLDKINNVIKNNAEVECIFLNTNKFIDSTIMKNKSVLDRKKFYNKSQEEVLKYLSSQSFFPGSVCDKAIKRKFLTNNRLLFEEGILSEDIDFMIRVLYIATRFDYCNCEYYFYRQKRDGSITNQNYEKRFESLFGIVKKYADINKSKYINSFIAYEYVILMAMCNNIKENSQVDELKKYKWLLTFNDNSKVKLAGIVCKTIGFKATCDLLNMYLMNRKY